MWYRGDQQGVICALVGNRNGGTASREPSGAQKVIRAIQRCVARRSTSARMPWPSFEAAAAVWARYSTAPSRSSPLQATDVFTDGRGEAALAYFFVSHPLPLAATESRYQARFLLWREGDPSAAGSRVVTDGRYFTPPEVPRSSGDGHGNECTKSGLLRQSEFGAPVASCSTRRVDRETFSEFGD